MCDSIFYILWGLAVTFHLVHLKSVTIVSLACIIQIQQMIMESLYKPDGISRTVWHRYRCEFFRIVHYGAPWTIDDYFQESGRAGRTGELSVSTVFWSPPDVSLRKDTTNPRILYI